MKTRTLLLLALVCGTAILLAGGLMLFQLTKTEHLADPTAIGQSVDVGDMTVIVNSAVETNGMLDVSVRIGGVDDDDGSDGFRLIASGRGVQPGGGAEGGFCGATTIAAVDCLVRFDVTAADGSSRVLFYERGDEQARWVIDRP